MAAQDSGYKFIRDLAKKRFDSLDSFLEVAFEAFGPTLADEPSADQWREWEAARDTFKANFRNYGRRGLPKDWSTRLSIVKLLLEPADRHGFKAEEIVACLQANDYPFSVLTELGAYFHPDAWSRALAPHLPPPPSPQDMQRFTTISDVERAWQRLEQLGRKRDEVPFPAPLPPGSSVPTTVRRKRHSIVRDAVLQQVATQLVGRMRGRQRGNQVVVAGAPGAGKSHLACEFVFRYGQYFQGGVFWLHSANPRLMEDQVIRCGSVDGLNLDPSFEKQPWYRQIERIRGAWARDLPRLLIFDHCDDPSIVRQYGPPPGLGGTFMLITTNAPEQWQQMNLPVVLFPSLNLTEARDLLQSYVVDDQGTLADLVAESGVLPLTLHLLGCFLSTYYDEPFGNPKQVLYELRRLRSAFRGQGIAPREFIPLSNSQTIGTLVALTDASLNEINPIDRLVKALLARVACFAVGESIPHDLLLATVTDADYASGTTFYAEKALQRLIDLGLLFIGDNGEVAMHEAVAQVIRDRGVDREANDVVEDLILKKAKEINKRRDVAAMRGFYMHLRTVADRALERGTRRAAPLCHEVGYHLWLLADFRGAQNYLEREYALIIQQTVIELEDLTETLSLRGLVLQMMCQYPAAQQLFEEALSHCEQTPNCPRELLVESEQNLGYLFLLTGKFDVAHELLARSFQRQQAAESEPDALVLDKDGLAKQALITAYCQHYMGFALLLQGQYAQAEQALAAAYNLRSTYLPEPHPQTAMTLHFLGELAFELGDYDRAWKHHVRAREMQELIYGTLHHDVSESYASLGRVLVARGEAVVGLGYLERALSLNRSLLGQHRETAYVLVGMAEAFLAQRDLGAAEKVLNEALTINRELYGERHPDWAMVRDLLGVRYLLERRYKEAEPHITLGLAVREAGLCPSHPHVAISLINRATLHEVNGNVSEARSDLRRALDICVATIPKHPRTHIIGQRLTTLDNMEK